MAVYTVTTHDVHVVGKGWYGQTMVYTYKLSSYDLENLGELTRDNVQRWLDTHSGDFQRVDDFWASLGEWESDWATEEGELTWNDCMFGEEE